MNDSSLILREWFSEFMKGYSPEAACFMAGESDRFRNPVGHMVRGSMEIILAELFGNMNSSAITVAARDIVRIRGVQDGDACAPLGFIDNLRQILSTAVPTENFPEMASRVDSLAAIAASEFEQCSAHISTIRANERRRSNGVAIAMMQARSN